MSIAGKAPKNTSQAGLAAFADQGLDYMVGTSQSNKTILAGVVIGADTTTVVDFKSLFGVTMKDTNYAAFVLVDDGSAVSVTAASRATTGFSIGGTAADDVINVLVIGTSAQQP